MAESILTKSQLRINLINGQNPDTGDPVFKTKLFNNIKVDATADQLYAVGSALVGLQQLPVSSYERTDNSEIIY